MVRYPVIRWAEFAHRPTETDMISPTPCIYCKRKEKIPVSVPLLQVGSKCGRRRRKSIETEWNNWRSREREYDVEQTSLSRIPRPCTPIEFQEDQLIPSPPVVAPPLLGNRRISAPNRRKSAVCRWARSDDAPFPWISFDSMDNLPHGLTQCAQKYLDGIQVDCNVENLWAISHLVGHLN